MQNSATLTRAVLLWLLFVAIVAGGCRISSIDEDGNIVTTGENALPDVVDAVTGVPSEDIIGAAKDAVSEVDIGEAIENVQSGNWLGIAGLAAAILGTIGLGVARRRKARKK